MDVTGNHGSVDFWMVKLNAVVGIEELSNESEMWVYPNPSNGVFTIDTKFNKGSIEVYDLLGNKISSKTANSNFTTIDIRNYKKGTYLLKLITKNKVIIEKIIYQ